MRYLRALFAAIALLSLCDAVAPVGTDTTQSFGGSTTTVNVTAAQTPAAGDVQVLSAIFGVASNSPTAPSGFTLQCSVPASGVYLWTHVVAASESPAYGAMTWTASGGIVTIAERSGISTTAPVTTSCPNTLVANTVASPSLALGTPPYQNALPEAVFETPTLTRCGGGAGTCNASGWTERTYKATTIFGESQINSTVAPQAGVTAAINFTTTTGSSVRILGWYDNPATLAPFPSPCNGAMMRGFIGC